MNFTENKEASVALLPGKASNQLSIRRLAPESFKRRWRTLRQPPMPQPQIIDFRIIEAVRLVESNYARHLDFTNLAATLNLSASRLRQLFKQQTGISFGKYLRQVRMQRAQLLLKTSFLKIKQVSQQVGISDTSHFVRDFEKQFGQSPAEYRKNYRSAKQKSAGKRIDSNNRKKIKKD